MAKFSPPNMQDDITRSSLRVPKAMLPLIEAAMATSPYNRKQRSKWIEDITKKFLGRSDAANLIAEEFIVPGSTTAIPILLSTELDDQISSMVETVSKEEGARKDRSSVIRTAITQHLMAIAGTQLSPKETREKIIASFGGFNESTS
jgi:metal-responsive CopG/Arc/MetJ family transcriptional regulator